MPTLKPVGSMYGMLAQPSAIAVSPTKRSRRPIATGSSVSPTVQTPSHCVLLRADAAADRRQQVGVGDDVVGAAEILRADLLDELRECRCRPGSRRRRAGPGTAGSARPRAAPPRACSRSATSAKFLARTFGSCSRIGVRSCGIVRIVFFFAISHGQSRRVYRVRATDRAASLAASVPRIGRAAWMPPRVRRRTGAASSCGSSPTSARARPSPPRCSARAAIIRSSKSTWWPSKSGPSTQANLTWPPTLTRQPPHMPVPSTMIGLRLTMVLMPCGRVASAQRLHHDRRADRDDFVDVGVPLDGAA